MTAHQAIQELFEQFLGEYSSTKSSYVKESLIDKVSTLEAVCVKCGWQDLSEVLHSWREAQIEIA